jgi:hypothetical protein
LAAWRCGGLSKPNLSVNDYFSKYKTSFKLSLNPPYCQTAVMGWFFTFSHYPLLKKKLPKPFDDLGS